jgi:hypothetical protein
MRISCFIYLKLNRTELIKITKHDLEYFTYSPFIQASTLLDWSYMDTVVNNL